MDNLDKLKIALKQKLAPDFTAGLVNLRNNLNLNSKKFDELIGIQFRYARIMEALHHGVITFDEAQIQLNKIFEATMYVINNLLEEDLA